MSQARGLTLFISDLRNCSNPDQERKRVEKEMAHIRSKFTSESNMNGYNRKKYVWKILYMYMLGYEVDFGHMEAVNLISSSKYSEKAVGYAWCALMLREGDELLRLIINSIRSDLISKQDNWICLALNSICNVGGKEFAEALANDVLQLLTANMTRTYVKKKAALTTLRLYRKSQDMLPAEEWADKILALLDEKNIGMLTSASSLVLGILAIDTQGWESCAAKAARTLTRLVLNKDYSNDYLYYGVPTPWLQIKLLRMLQYFPPPEEHALKMRVSEVLQRIVQGTDVTKNVNKNNVTHAVLFEAINLVIHLGHTTDLLPTACGLLGRFISIREANIRYLGLETMARLSVAQPDTMDALKKHQSTILFSLKDQDISIRRRALDLVYSMCDTSTVKETVAELLSYLETADMHLKEELVLKIAILAERFRSEHEWYVDVILALVTTAGDFVSEEIWYRVVQIVTNQGDDLQAYAAKKVWDALTKEVMPHRTLVKIAGYMLGEFGHTIAEAPGSSAADQLRVLHKHFMHAEPDTKALLLNTYAKLSHAYGEISSMVGDVLRVSATALDQEVQQRSVEYLALGGANLGGVKGQVLEMMPPFTERESIVQTKLSKSQADTATNMPAKAKGDQGGREDGEDGEEVAPVVDIGGGGAPPVNLMGDDPPPTSAAADLLGDLSLGGAPAAPPAAPAAPAAPTSAADDLLGLMDAPGGARGATSRRRAAARAPAASVGASSPQYRALCVRNDGVLYEDATIQVGVKMEFQAHQGRIGLFFGNKGGAPLSGVATKFSECAGLALQPNALAPVIGPRAQQTQMVMVQCGGPYAEPPTVSFVSDGVSLSLLLPLPPTKFNVPLEVAGPEFFRRWNGLDGKEKQLVFKLNPAASIEQVLTGLQFAVLKGVDPNAANFVAAGWMATRGGAPQADGASLLARLEINAQAGMCRASVRSLSAPLCQSTAEMLQGHLAAPQ